MAKKSAISVRVDEELKDALEKAAKDDRRSMGSLVELVLSDWLKEHGYLPE